MKIYRLTPALQEISLSDVSSLDAVSRQLPQGLYSTFRTYGERSKALGLEWHLNRLYDPLAGLTVKATVSAAQVRFALAEALSAWEGGEARVRLSLSLAEESAGEVFLALEPLQAPSEAVYQRGVRVLISHEERNTPRLKTTRFIGSSAEARSLLAQSGAYEALMVRNGRILEGLTSNFYVVRGGIVQTARNGILLGVTRRYVLRLARSLGFGVLYRPPLLEDLAEVEEAFLTSSGRGVVPIVQVGDALIGNGQVGEAARLLRRAYDEYVLAKAERISPV